MTGQLWNTAQTKSWIRFRDPSRLAGLEDETAFDLNEEPAFGPGEWDSDAYYEVSLQQVRDLRAGVP